MVNNEPLLNIGNAIPDFFIPSDTAWDYTFPFSTFTEPDGDPISYRACVWDGATCNNLPYAWGTVSLAFDAPNRRF